MQPDLKVPSSPIHSSVLQEKNQVVVVIPTYNDELTIGSIILKLKRQADTVIVTDDCSSDRTIEIAQTAGSEVLLHQKQVGRGHVVIAGLQRAYELGCQVAVLIDGDSRYKSREVPFLSEHILNGEADLVIGSRYLGMNGFIPLKQKFKQNMLSAYQERDEVCILTDPLSGCMVFGREALRCLDFSFDEYSFHQDLINHFIAQNLSIKEAAITERTGISPKIRWGYSHKIILALPAFNEEQSLPAIIEVAAPFVDLVLVVDDGSTDTTALVARKMGAFVVRHPNNRGYGAALQTIFSHARDLYAEALIIMDSDGQHDPKEIPLFLESLLSGADLVIGSRYLDGAVADIPRYRRVGMKMLDKATSVAGVKQVTDTQSGFRGYRRRAVDMIQIYGNGMSAGSEILIRACDNHLSIAEVPITVRYNLSDTSTQNPFHHGIAVLGKILALISYRRPLPAFGIPGLFFFSMGIGITFYAYHEYSLTSEFPSALSRVGEVFLLLGVLLGITGLILNAFLVFMRKR